MYQLEGGPDGVFSMAKKLCAGNFNIFQPWDGRIFHQQSPEDGMVAMEDPQSSPEVSTTVPYGCWKYIWGQCGCDGNLPKIWDLSKRSDTMGFTFINRMFIQLYSYTCTCLFERVLNFCLLPKNDLIGQTRVSSDIFMPNPFCSCENARPNGEKYRTNARMPDNVG